MTSRQKKRIAARRRVLFLERLEEREVLAGNVTAAIRGGDLFVNGDSHANDITITRSGSSSLTITGNGTAVNGLAAVTLTNFNDDVVINLNGGNDKLTFEKTIDDLFRLPGRLTINTAGGNDEINLSDMSVKDHVHINAGSGNDQINAFAETSTWGFRALSTATILTGSGHDVVSLDDSSFHKTANILLERGDDRLFLSHTSFNKAAIFNGGRGFDRLDTVATSFAKRPVVVLFEVRGGSPPPANNILPVAANNTGTVAEGGTTSIDVAANDTDSDGSLNLASIVVTQNPARGTVVVNSNGSVSYTHNGSETTSDSFRYTIKDNDGAVSNTATVNITITPVNDAPVAVNDTATVAEGGNVSIPVSTNDTDADGTIDATSIVVTQNPANGTFVVNSNGSVSYTHNGSDTTSDSFRYTIKDNTGAVSGTATVNITVTPVNDPPVAVNDTATFAEGANGSINVASNDTDSDGTIDLTSIVVTQNPANGSATVNSNGTVSYIHNGSETTSDSFFYTIKDNSGAVSGTATVNITITPVNDAPVAVNDTGTVAEGASGSINVASNDTDADGTIDVATVVITQTPANGTAVANVDGTVTYTHNGSETTSDSFRYTIKDNSGLVSGTGTVNITVTPVNDAPVAVNDTGTVAEGAAANITASSNDSDPEGALDLTSITIIQTPAHGTATPNANGSVTYTHDGSETTSDSFTYTIKDATGAVSSTATVAITITPVNDPPVAVDDLLTVNEGSGGSVNVSTNDTDSDGTLDLTSVTIVQIPANGTAVANADGTVTYTHNGSETTSDSFTYTIKDNLGAVSGTATVTVTVTPVNDAPVAVNDNLTVDEGTGGSVNVSTNDTDTDGTIDVATVVITQNPAHGTAVANSDGTVTYTNNGDEATNDSFTYTIKDNNGLVSGTATVSVTVTPVNDAPIAVDDVLTLAEGAGASVNVAVNDTDADGTIDVATVVIIQTPAHGTAVANLDGTVTYTHDGSETTSDSFRYTIKDNTGAVSGTATVAITVTTVNDPPVAVDDVFTVDEGTGGAVNVATNDTDVDGSIDVGTIVIIQTPAHGTAVANLNGTVTYTHDGSETTTDSFTYTIKDNIGLVSGTATVTVTVTPVNDAPVAVDDVLTVNEGSGGNVNVSTNETDSDGTLDLTSVTIVQIPANGTAVANADGTVTYTHNGSETTSDSFTYTIKDNLGAVSGTATVTVTVTPVNDAPVAVNDNLTVDEGTGGSVNVSTNDTDTDGTIDVATVVITQNPAHGTAVANSDGTVTYTNNGDEATNDSFTYTIKDNNGLVSGTATVSVTVTPVNDAPIAVDDVLTLAEGAGASVNVAVNDTDADGTIDVATVVIIQTPAHGTAVANLDGTVTYTHDGSETTSDTFTYTIKDNNGLVSGTATVTVTVTPVNDAPVAIDDAATVNEDTLVTIDLATNDTDTDGTIDLTSIVVVQGPAHGGVVVNADGTVSYTHDGSETASDSFTYTIKDNNGLVSSTATVSITVTLVNDAPVANDDSATVDEGAAMAIDVAANDTDADGTIDLTSIVVIQNPAHGNFVVNSDGTVTYTHDGSETTTDSFTYTIKDNNGLVSDTATVTLTVTPVNDAPIAVNDVYTIDEDGSLILPAPGVLGNDTDAEGNSLGASLITGPLHGSLSLAADGSLTYTPDPDFNGTDGFSYLVNDGTADSNVAAVTINVNSVNDAPIAIGDLANVSIGGFTTIDLAANDTDVDNALDLHSIIITQQPVDGTLIDNLDGTVTYTHTGAAAGSDSFKYTIKDASSAVSNEATVLITIT